MFYVFFFLVVCVLYILVFSCCDRCMKVHGLTMNYISDVLLMSNFEVRIWNLGNRFTYKILHYNTFGYLIYFFTLRARFR